MSDTGDGGLKMPDDAALARIIAAIDDYNAKRGGAQTSVYLNVALYMVPYGLAMGAIATLFFLDIKANGDKSLTGYLLAFLFFGGIWAGKALWELAWKPATDLQGDTRYRLFPEIFGFVEKMRYSNGITPRFMSSLPAAEILLHSRVVHDDLIEGLHEGTAFALGECVFYHKQGKSEAKTFQGVIFHSTSQRRFPGLLIVTKSQTAANRFWFGGPKNQHLSEVIAEDWSIRSAHDIRSDNPRAAQALIDGAVGTSVRWLDRRWTDGVTRIALRQHDIYLFVPSDRNFFELPSIGVPVDFRTHVEPMIHELVALLATGGLIRKALDEQLPELAGQPVGAP